MGEKVRMANLLFLASLPALALKRLSCCFMVVDWEVGSRIARGIGEGEEALCAVYVW
jgi:hypothetical protein